MSSSFAVNINKVNKYLYVTVKVINIDLIAGPSVHAGFFLSHVALVLFWICSIEFYFLDQYKNRRSKVIEIIFTNKLPLYNYGSMYFQDLFLFSKLTKPSDLHQVYFIKLQKKGKMKISKVKRNNHTTNKMKKAGTLRLQRHRHNIQKQKQPAQPQQVYHWRLKITRVVVPRRLPWFSSRTGYWWSKTLAWVDQIKTFI